MIVSFLLFLFVPSSVAASELEQAWVDQSMRFDHSAETEELRRRLDRIAEKNAELGAQWESELAFRAATPAGNQSWAGIGQMGPTGIMIRSWGELVKDPWWRDVGSYAMLGVFLLGIVLAL